MVLAWQIPAQLLYDRVRFPTDLTRQSRLSSILEERAWLGALAGRARNKDKSADSGSHKHSWSHCSENRSL